eukprot:gnl/TRDRNA2_/TRDRNA2_195622_c0_seq1.p1 gnl/TRDRNA2_/TRDRNA2_195622_c0~~gnl/TRDRNA2_/TRDRNA2_195622_c0_seq1.p1  ORF type:complete len:128 (-),score=22.85 gnl/TRDRNA2_/TRDRNA2_195622_c0_seq1:110-493(-)
MGASSPKCCCTSVGEEQSQPVDVLDVVATSPPAKAIEGSGGTEMVVDFKLHDGKIQTIVFQRKPLGLDFEKKAPIVVSKVQTGSHAEKIGVRIGMTMVKICGQDITEKDFTYQFALLRKASKMLASS